MSTFSDVIPAVKDCPALLVFMVDKDAHLSSLVELSEIAMKYRFEPCPYSTDAGKGRYVFVIGPEVPLPLQKDLDRWSNHWEHIIESEIGITVDIVPDESPRQ